MSVEDINRVTLAGGLTRDPELRRSNGGTPVLNLRLAYAKRGGHSGEDLETQYVDVVCRGALAVKVARDLHRGSQIYVDGKLDLRTWVDRSTGQDRQVHRVDAGAIPSNVIYLSANRLRRTHAVEANVASAS
jgi:single-strand DNA-binding protein